MKIIHSSSPWLLLALLPFAAGPAAAADSAQVTPTWVAHFTNYASQAFPRVMKLDAAGNVYVGGEADGAGTGLDFVTVKYDANGQQLWTTRFNNETNAGSGDILLDLAVDNAGNVYVTGSGRDQSDYVTLKYDLNGHQLWTARYYACPWGYLWSAANVVAVDGSGNVYISGGVEHVGITTVKYDGNGQQLWAKNYVGSYGWWDAGRFIRFDAAGNVYVGGESWFNGSQSEWVVLKYSPDGQEIWTAHSEGRYGSAPWMQGMDMDAQGNIYCAGGGSDCYSTVKFDPTGALVWGKTYSAPAHTVLGESERGYTFVGGLALDNQGNVLVTGTSVGRPWNHWDDPIHDFLTVKYDPNGNQLWAARQAAHGMNGYVTIAVDSEDNPYITGGSWQPDTGDDYLTIKYDRNGNRIWMTRFQDPQASSPNHVEWPGPIAVDDAGNVYVTGVSVGNGIATVKYAQNTVTGLPVIITPPQSQTVVAGTRVVLSVTANGEEPLTYQWRWDGIDLEDAHEATLVLAHALQSQAGEYSVEVRNARGATATPEALLTITEPRISAERTLPSTYCPGAPFLVNIYVLPDPGVQIYAVEDQPPAGWVVSDISVGGVFDSTTHKVKFGPFMDDYPRDLTYQVTPPSAATGPVIFTGTCSADGAVLPILGQTQLPYLHPADNAPGDWTMSMGEMTGYGAAWRLGQSWPLPPNPIPIDYVTRAAALWENGEGYTMEASLEPPLCWVSLESQQQTGALGVSASTANTLLPSCYIPGEALTVSIQVSPAATVSGFAVEHSFPAGWTISGISQGGGLDSVNQKVKWGPFLDSLSRTFAYQATPPASAHGAAGFSGTASFDGSNLAIDGTRQFSPGSRLSLSSQTQPGQRTLQLAGEAGQTYLIETSTDLLHWTPLTTITLSLGPIAVPDPDGAAQARRFYRASLYQSP